MHMNDINRTQQRGRLQVAMMIALLLPGFVQASVSGFCERDGARLTFTDGIAFWDARGADGAITTTVYLTAKPLDRSALSACVDCRDALTEDDYSSPRGKAVEQQKSAVNDGWIELSHTGGESGTGTIGNIMYLAKDGVLNGISGTNSTGSLSFSSVSETHVSGAIKTVPTPPEYFDDTDMTCDVSFDLPVGWPK